MYLWLPSADIAVARIAERVRSGGHNVPEATVCRRYDSGLKNFFHLYKPMTSTWQFHDNAGLAAPRCVADGVGATLNTCTDQALWKNLEARYGRE